MISIQYRDGEKITGHFLLIKQWEKKHPNWEKSEDETNQYMLLVQKMMADVDEDKCITEISKNAVIPKD